jgi:iron complex transport system ATP-binding protein
MNALAVSNVEVFYGEFQALFGVSLEVNAGETVAIIGANGAGKTTLLRAIAGLAAHASGEVWFGGDRLDMMKAADRARLVAYMPQSAASHPFTAIETVLMGRYPHLGRFETEGAADHAAAHAAMDKTATAGFASRQLDTLSGGERQRVLLARALAQDAPVLLLDEPTASLDIKHRLLTMELARDEARAHGAVAVLAMHDLSLAARYCDRLALLCQGRLLAAGAPDEVLTAANIRAAFDVEALVDTDPLTGTPRVSLLRAL